MMEVLNSIKFFKTTNKVTFKSVKAIYDVTTRNVSNDNNMFYIYPDKLKTLD